MADSLVIKSVHNGTRLELTGDIPRGREGYDGVTFTATLSGGPVSASVDVYDIRFHHWTEFFSELAANWRGWADVKTCESLEGHLLLSATSDRAGHVQLRVCLSSQQLENDWSAECPIHLEAGQLDALARSASPYFGG